MVLEFFGKVFEILGELRRIVCSSPKYFFAVPAGK